MSRRKKSPQSATSLEMAPEQDERARERRYLLTMGIRMACFALAVFIHPYGWYTAVLAVGAVFLPWVAVVAANARSRTRVDYAVAPEGPVLDAPPTRADGQGQDEILLEDVALRDERPDERRDGRSGGDDA